MVGYASPGRRGLFWRGLQGMPSWHLFPTGAGNADHAQFSPDGHWLAYESDQTGSSEIYVSRFPDGPTHRISTGGGQEPRWRTTGNELFYIGADDQLIAADIANGFEHATSSVLFKGPFRRGSDGPIYDASADGQRFIILASDNVDAPDTIDVILNWPSLLRKN